MRWVWRATAALIVVVISGVAVVHSPPVRRAALHGAVAAARDRLHIVLQADDLTYNLLHPAPRVTFRNLAVAATDTADRPFFRAGELTITLPWSALWGPFRLDAVHGERAHVRIVRGADGRINLPGGGPPRPGGPPAILIERLSMPQLAVEWVDEPPQLDVLLPVLAIDLGRSTGRLQLEAAGSIRRAGVETEISELAGALAFDGRRAQLSRIALTTGEASLTIDGTIGLLVAGPTYFDLRLSGRTDVPGAARWATDAHAPRGTADFDGAFTGRLGAPRLQARLHSHTLLWGPLTFTGLTGEVDLDLEADRLQVTRLDASVGGGRVTVAGELPFSGPAAFSGSWSALNAAVLVRALAPDLPLRPASFATGRGTATGAEATLAGWQMQLRSRLEPGRIRMSLRGCRQTRSAPRAGHPR